VPEMRLHPDPRVYLADTTRPIDNYAQAVAMMADGHDFHRAPLVEPGWAVSLPPCRPRPKRPARHAS
ncbi:MAG TPA: hypothetical protein VF550_20410, partial [Polyangia bacterium]